MNGRELDGRRILLGVTGGIAAYKAVVLLRALVEAGADVEVVMTPTATRFVGSDTFAALSGRPVHSGVFERPGEVLHVGLARRADIAVVAPATANALARLALGLADDLLTSALLEASCPLVVAPAMHTGMWNHPATRQHVETLRRRGAVIVGPSDGSLAGGDAGVGRMAEPDEIATAVAELLGAAVGDLAGYSILVTAGPTHEPIDPVRFLGNRSTGRMGFALAAEARRRGARVTLVAGPVELTPPAGVEIVRVQTAREMADEVTARYTATDAVVMAAAVADWRPTETAIRKLKKEAGPPTLALERTTDILAALGKAKERQVLVGFAAETSSDPTGEGRRKLAEKNLDLLVANVVGEPDTGFGADTDRAAILAATGQDAPLRPWTKAQLAAAVLDRVAALLGARRA